MDALAPEVDGLLATANADPYPRTVEYAQRAEALIGFVQAVRDSDPPPAAAAYVDALAGQWTALQTALRIEGRGGNAVAKYEEADRLYAEAERLRVGANLACAG